MGHARDIMDRITDAVMAGDRAALERLYAADAVVEGPEGAPLHGAEAIADYFLSLRSAFPDSSWEGRSKLESGDTAIDEGYFTGTHTGPLSTPDGDIAATGRSLRLRECDLVTVRDGAAVAHRLYYDQVDFMSQLGLGEPATSAAPQQSADAGQASGATVG